MTQNVGEYVATVNGDTPKPVQMRPGGWQSRRKMVTLYVALGFTTLGWFTTANADHSSAATPPAVAAAPAPAPIPAPVAPPVAPSVVTPPPPPAEVKPEGVFGDGTYEVGTDIPAGKYKTTGEGGNGVCYYARLKTGDGSYGDIIDNDILNGQGVITVKKSDGLVELSGGCTWIKQKK